MLSSPQTALNVTSWRREVHALYDAVRAEHDPAAAHRLWVETRSRMFQEHPASARSGEQRLQHAEYDPAYRFVLPLMPADPEDWTYATATDGDVPFVRVGRFELPDLGAADVWWLDSYGGGLFLPLKDRTAGRTSYGAGRYLLDTVKGAELGQDPDGHWVVDLNFAYNPSCAYDPAWACPLAPVGNHLAGDVPVGELLPTGG